MHELTALTIFAEVVSARSFSGAATRLDLSKATVSKHISRLEATLGMKLLNRTTRSLSLTEAGAALFIRCRKIIDEADLAFAELACFNDRWKGVLRVCAPVSFGARYIVPILTEFLACHGDTKAELTLVNPVDDPPAQNYDIVVRIAHDPDPRSNSERLARCPTVLCAAPMYLQRHGAPVSPADLARHDCLVLAAPPRGEVWRFARNGETFEIRVEGQLLTNDGEAMRLGLLSGLGIAFAPRFLVERDLADGKLVALLRDYATPELTAFLLFPRRHQATGHVLAFVEAVATRFESLAKTSATTVGDPPAAISPDT